MSEITKALSVRAPWAWAIMHGKPVENRDWSTGFRGVIWLHQSKHWSRREYRGRLRGHCFHGREGRAGSA